MLWTDIVARLNDLPATFTRSGPNFTAFQAALTNGLHKLTTATEGAINQSEILQATGKWLDVAGKARNIPRYPGETDATYQSRIHALLNTPGGPPNAILAVLSAIGYPTAILTENFATTSWQVKLPAYLPPLQQLQISDSLNRVRPAGIPFNVGYSRGGLYLNTSNYLGRSRTTGAYLVNSVTYGSGAKSTNTNSAIALLPTVYLSDITLNAS